MSCDAVASIALFWLAATGQAAPQAHLIPVSMSSTPSALSQEPLFADIVKRAAKLKGEVTRLVGADKPVSDALKTQVAELSDLDMQGHLTLAKRGTDGDLKCILRGISQDLPLKLGAVTAAADRKARDAALKEMAYLLNDNVEVITAPPAPPV